jgi:ABC-2 type transport system permease protein
MPGWAQAIGTAIPVTHFLRVVRGSLLKGVGLAEAAPSLFALVLFSLVITALAMSRYRTTLD